MNIITYSILFALATFWLAALLNDRLPRTIGGAMSLAMWLALVPASFAVEIGLQSGSPTTIQEPVLAFVSVLGFAVSGLFVFADVTGQISRRTEAVGGER